MTRLVIPKLIATFLMIAMILLGFCATSTVADVNKDVSVDLLPIDTTVNGGMVTLRAKVRVVNRLDVAIVDVRAVAQAAGGVVVTPPEVAVGRVLAGGTAVVPEPVAITYPEPRQNGPSAAANLSWSVQYATEKSRPPSLRVAAAEPPAPGEVVGRVESIRLPSFADRKQYDVSLHEQRLGASTGSDTAVAALLAIAQVSSLPVFERYDEARKAYETVMEAYPEYSLADDTAWYLARLEMTELGDYAAAATVLQKALDQYGKIVFEEHPLLKIKPHKDLPKDDLTVCIGQLLALNAKLSVLPPDSLERASFYASNGSPLPAERIYRKIISATPSSPAAENALMGLAQLCRGPYLDQLNDRYQELTGGTSHHRGMSRRGELMQLAVACYQAILEKFPQTEYKATATLHLAQAYMGVPFLGERVKFPEVSRPSSEYGDPAPDAGKAENLFGSMPLSPSTAPDAGQVNLLVGDAYYGQWKKEGKPDNSALVEKALQAYQQVKEMTDNDWEARASRRIKTLMREFGE